MTANTDAPEPQVIDLDAEDVVVDADRPSPPPIPPAPRHRQPWRWYAAAVLLGALAGGWLYRGVIANYLPSDQLTTAQARIQTLDSQVKTLSEQMARVASDSDLVKQQQQAQSATLTSATDAAGAATQAAQAQASRLAALETSATEMKTGLQAVQASLKAGLPSGSSSPPDNAALSAIANRLDVVEKDIAALKAAAAPSDHAVAATALKQAMADLKAKVAAGTGYAPEYDRLSRIVPAAAGLETLAQNANQGLPNAQGLATELTAQLPALPKAQPEAADDGYFAPVWNALKGVITVRRLGDTDWADLAQRAATAASSGDLPQAIALIDKAEGERPAIISTWRDRAAARLKLEEAVGQTADSVARQLATLDAAP
jgi:hypothetical protein